MDSGSTRQSTANSYDIDKINNPVQVNFEPKMLIETKSNLIYTEFP